MKFLIPLEEFALQVELRDVLSKVIDIEKNIKKCLQGDSNNA
jgi:hypothetical protein